MLTAPLIPLHTFAHPYPVLDTHLISHGLLSLTEETLNLTSLSHPPPLSEQYHPHLTTRSIALKKRLVHSIERNVIALDDEGTLVIMDEQLKKTDEKSLWTEGYGNGAVAWDTSSTMICYARRRGQCVWIDSETMQQQSWDKELAWEPTVLKWMTSDQVALAGSNGHIHLIDTRSGTQTADLHSMDLIPSHCTALCIDPNRSYRLAACDNDANLMLWDQRNTKSAINTSLPSPGDSLCWQPDTAQLFVGTRSGPIQMVDINDQSVRNPFDDCPESWASVSFVGIHPVDSTLVALSDSGHMLVAKIR